MLTLKKKYLKSITLHLKELWKEEQKVNPKPEKGGK